METSPTTISPLLLRNILSSLFIFADKSLLNVTKKYKLLEILHCLFVSLFLFFSRLLPSIFPSFDRTTDLKFSLKTPKSAIYATDYSGVGSGGGSGSGSSSGDLGIVRALSQLLSIVNEVPVSSRKYEVVRSLVEKLIDDNHQEGIEKLRDVNRAVLSAAFDRTISQIEGAVVGGRSSQGDGGGDGESPGVDYSLYRVVRAVKLIGDSAWMKFGRGKEGGNESGIAAEKLAAELLWLAQKMSCCGCSGDACLRWASAARLGRAALSAEQRLQGSLLRVAAFMFKQVKNMGTEEGEGESEKQQWRQTKLKMLIAWLPLLCRGSSGTDTPVLTIGERNEVEAALEETVGRLKQDEQEEVLAVWLHHFTMSSTSDWPNMYSSYARWYNASRKLLIHHGHFM